MSLFVRLIDFNPGVLWMANGMNHAEEVMVVVVALESVSFSNILLKGC